MTTDPIIAAATTPSAPEPSPGVPRGGGTFQTPAKARAGCEPGVSPGISQGSVSSTGSVGAGEAPPPEGGAGAVGGPVRDPVLMERSRALWDAHFAHDSTSHTPADVICDAMVLMHREVADEIADRLHSIAAQMKSTDAIVGYSRSAAIARAIGTKYTGTARGEVSSTASVVAEHAIAVPASLRVTPLVAMAREIVARFEKLESHVEQVAERQRSLIVNTAKDHADPAAFLIPTVGRVDELIREAMPARPLRSAVGELIDMPNGEALAAIIADPALFELVREALRQRDGTP